MTLPGDNPDPSDPSDPSGPQYAVKRCNVQDIEVLPVSKDGKTVQPDPIAGTTESYGAHLVGAWSSDGTACFPDAGNVDRN
ncbi:MAG TPA: hypothetical protein VFH27_00195, partial [Longimicrobiaceae bacterium]|nr:hypothetical protein [Longimicrobiaceae bacterium]